MKTVTFDEKMCDHSKSCPKNTVTLDEKMLDGHRRTPPKSVSLDEKTYVRSMKTVTTARKLQPRITCAQLSRTTPATNQWISL